MRYPLFSWDTIPTYIHMCNESGPFNEITNQRLATYPIVTIEKCQGIHSNGSLPYNYSSQYEETKILDACQAIKQINDSILCIFYINSILDFTNYYLHIDMIENPSYKLRDDNDIIVYEKGGGSLVPQPGNGFWVFDFQQENVQNLFISECINATKSKYIDGVFIDRSDQNTFAGNYTFSNLTLSKYTIGHNNVLYQIQKQLNDSNQSISIVKSNTTNGIIAIQIEGFKAAIEELNELIELSNNGIIVEAHVYGHQCDNFINSLSCFLMGAQMYSYYACSGGWTIQQWPDHNVFHKPLGKPISNAILNGDVWQREFQGIGNNKTIVKWNQKTFLGEITWPDGSVQIGVNGSQI